MSQDLMNDDDNDAAFQKRVSDLLNAPRQQIISLLAQFEDEAFLRGQRSVVDAMINRFAPSIRRERAADCVK